MSTQIAKHADLSSGYLAR